MKTLLSINGTDALRFISFCIGFFVPVYFLSMTAFEHYMIQYTGVMIILCPVVFVFAKKYFGELLG